MDGKIPSINKENKIKPEEKNGNLEDFSKIQESLAWLISNLGNFKTVGLSDIEDPLEMINKHVNNFTSVDKESFDLLLQDPLKRMLTIENLNRVMAVSNDLIISCDDSLEKVFEIQRAVKKVFNKTYTNFLEFPENYDIEKNIVEGGNNINDRHRASIILFDFFSAIESVGNNLNELSLVEKVLNYKENRLIMFFKNYNTGVYSKGLFSLLYNYGQDATILEIDKFLDSIAQNVSLDMDCDNFIKNVLNRNSPLFSIGKIEKRLYKNLNEYFKIRYGIEQKNFAESLNYINGLAKKIRQMDEIEFDCPGGVKLLNEKYNICEFERYPKEVLIEQINNEDDQKPYGLIIFPRSDYNGAFYNFKDSIKNIYNETRDNHLVKIFEASSKIDVARILIDCNKRYGLKNKISYLIIGGHGTAESLDLGSQEALLFKDKNKKIVDKNDFEGEGVKKVKEFFVEKPAITLISCSTGADEGLIDSISQQYNAEVVAPKIPTSVEDMHVKYDEEGKPHFNVTWSNNEANSLYVSGNKIN